MISFIQLAPGAAAGAAVNCPFGVNVTQGNLLLAFVQITNVHVNTITDTMGNVWTISQNQHPSEVGSPFNIVSAWAIAKATGACTVSFNMSAAGGGVPFGCAVEYSATGQWAAPTPTNSFYRDCNTGNPCTVGAMGAGKVGTMVVLFGSLYTSGTVWTPNAGFTLRTGGGAGSVLALCDSITGANNPQLTLTTNQNTFGLGFQLDEILPPKQLQATFGLMGLPGFTIAPIEEE